MMTDIEKAINNICEHCIAEYGNDICNGTTCSKRICVKALTEMAEREKGCYYCYSEKLNNTVCYTPNELISAEVDMVEFIYCPICGRDLRKAVKQYG